jgi:hypothetical protein
MIILPNSLTVNFNDQPFTVGPNITYSVIYNPSIKYCGATIHGLPRSIPLWTDTAYVSAGDWTDTETDQRLLYMLGDNPTQTLSQHLTSSKELYEKAKIF